MEARPCACRCFSPCCCSCRRFPPPPAERRRSWWRPRLLRARHFHGFHHGRAFRSHGSRFGFGRSAHGYGGYGGWGYFPDWDWDGGWDGDWAWNGGNAAAVPAPAYFPPPRPPRLAADERPSVETTAQGVTIIRGPGSRHLPP